MIDNNLTERVQEVVRKDYRLMVINSSESPFTRKQNSPTAQKTKLIPRLMFRKLSINLHQPHTTDYNSRL
jgi:hypothetical protein